MKLAAIAIAVLALIGSITYALPAQCAYCASTVPCYNDIICGQDCKCYQPQGPGTPGFCG